MLFVNSKPRLASKIRHPPFTNRDFHRVPIDFHFCGDSEGSEVTPQTVRLKPIYQTAPSRTTP